MRPSFFLLPGWAHGPADLAPLAAALSAELQPAQTPEQAELLIGWSLGALRALARAAGPDKPRALVLIGGTARFCATDGYDAGLPETALRVMMRTLKRSPDATLADFHRRCAHPFALTDEQVRARTAASLSLGTETLAAGLDDLRALDLRDAIAAVSCPVLLLHGEADAVIPPSASRWLADRLPDAELALVPGCGHDLPLRDPVGVAGRILAFVRKRAGVSP